MPKDCDIIIKKGYITSDYEEKGMGSAYGGEWQPKKEEDKRFLGEPGEIKETISKRGNYVRHTKIGKGHIQIHTTILLIGTILIKGFLIW